MRAKILFHLRWAAAIFVAALFGGGARIHKSFLALFGILRDRGEMVPEEVYRKRMEACQNCPLFYAPLQTCGTPLKKELRDVGCFCFSPIAARFASKSCWLDETLGDGADEHGWYAATSQAQVVHPVPETTDQG